MANNQPGVGLAAEVAQGAIQTGKGLADEFDTPVAAAQPIQDGAVKHEDAVNLLARLQGLAQGSVVVRAQIAPEPHQAGWVR